MEGSNLGEKPKSQGLIRRLGRPSVRKEIKCPCAHAPERMRNLGSSLQTFLKSP